MRRLRNIFAILALLSTASCAVDNIDVPSSITPANDVVTVIGRMTRFDDKDVTTRGVKDQDEAKLTSMAMAIFKVNAAGNGLDGGCVYYQYAADQAELLFTIERGSKYDYGARYVIYVFCNMPGMSDNVFGVGSTLEEMMEAFYKVENIDIPANGFPMMGSLGDTFSTTFDRDNQEFILSPLDDKGNLTTPKVNGVTKTLLTIPMKAMFAKVNFTIEVRPDQTIDGNYSPQFTLDGCTVNNIPSTVDFINSTNSESKVLADSFSPTVTGNTVASGANRINFTFYLPERYLEPATKATDYAYPFKKDGKIRAEDSTYMQRYKPQLVGDKKATNVVISGRFRDHQNHHWNVDYTIFLGEDNYGDFNIKRNSEYHNYVTIRGIQSSDDMSDEQDAISIDHRVNVERTQPAIISLRREVLLDSHFEVRPLRVRKSDIGDVAGINAVKVEVVNYTTTNWMRLERSFGDGTPEGSLQTTVNGEPTSIYIDSDPNSASYGKRKFFTFDLVTGGGGTNGDVAPLNESTSVILPLTDATECCWIYVDECTEVGDAVRSGIVKVSYGSYDGKDFKPANNATYPDVNYVINQRKLFQVDNSGRKYNIEYEEEYLHNFDADDSYGETEYEGMQWGLYYNQLSYKYPAVYVDLSGGILSWLDDLGWDFDDLMNNVVSGIKPYYDFYLTRDKNAYNLTEDTNYDDEKYDGIIIRDFSGFSFCNDIINVINGYGNLDTSSSNDINVLQLDQKPESAVEYCYNKNKRIKNGQVATANNTDNLKWYLPSIDEIEDIVTSKYGNGLNTYARFLEFQDKFYWSSQPAYYYNDMKFSLYIRIFGKVHLGTATGKLFEDNIGDIKENIPGFARATKVEYVNGQYVPAESTINGASNSVYIEYYNSLSDPKYTPISPQPSYKSGYKPRNSMARVRCVRKQ